MTQLWILMDNSVELPTDSTTAWITLCVAHISTTPTKICLTNLDSEKFLSKTFIEK